MAAGYYSPSSDSSGNSQSMFPLHLRFFLFTLLLFLSFTWYMNYESLVESILDQVKVVFIVSPLLLLVVLRWLSGRRRWGGLWLLISMPERESLHRAGGTPWGIGFLLVILFFMISYKSYFQELWFPLLSK